MYSAARDGQPLLELAPVQLPKPSAEYVLSGKYAETKDPRAELMKMVTNLGLRSSIANPGSLGAPLQDTLAQMKDAERRGDRKRASLLAQLLQVERQGDRDAIVRIKDLLAQSGTTSVEKKVD